ncbi:MAG: DUF1983 domain-containing protein, partial [Mannheimia varigena]|nr:DUF1983 domain-containing protein [Mannheimia varigena]
GLGNITLEWDWVNEVTQTEIFAAETDNFALAEKIAKVTARTYAHTLKGDKVVRYYWLRHTRGINVGPFYQQQGVKGESAVDLDARLKELNTELSRNIVNEIFDVAAPARGLELVKTVANLTDRRTKLASSQVYNQADGKLYTWDGTAYSAAVPTEDIIGKLPKSKIDTSLISQLTSADNTANLARRLAETAQSNINQEITNRQDAVTAEANNRTKAIQAESANLTKKIQAEATARGAAVTQLQNVDAQQAQLISAVTTKANNALSGLEEERTVRANGDKAESQAREALTARMNNAESNITRNTTAITTLNQSTATQLNTLNSKMSSAESNIATIQSTKANKSEVASLAQSSLQSIWRADAKSAVDSLSIGARNLLIDSSYIKYANYNPDMAVITSSSYQGRRLLRLGILGGTGVAGIVQASVAQVSNIIQGQEYTLSLNVQGTSGIQKTGLNHVLLMRADGDNQRLATIPVIASLSNRPKITFTAEWTSERAYLLIGVIGTYQNTDWLAFHSVKLEKGNVATDWTPAPEDIESSVNAISSKVDSVQQTLTTANQALGSRIDTVTASVNDAKSQVSQVSKAVSDVSGKLSATSTLKTQVIAGGRKAIAGIALGAESDGVTTESSVIVMADKFAVVRNAQDSSPKSLFTVQQNKVAINGDLIATGTIKGSHIDADSVRAGILTAGAIRTEHLAAGQISADKLAIGLGGNLLYNPIFANNGNGWLYYVDTSNIENNGYGFNNATGTYQSGAYLPTENQFRLQRTRKSTTGDVRLGGLYQDMKLTSNTYYCFSAYVGGHRSYVDLNIEGGGVQIIRKSWSGRGRTGGYPNNTIETGIESYYRIWILFKTNATNPAETNYRLIINTWGQNGQDNPMFIIRRPMLEECTQHTTAPSAWVNAGVTSIHGGSIVTNTVTAQQIAANTITANEIAAGTIAARNMAANSINASHIVSKSLTADKFNVVNLAAISANLGAINAGSININNRFKVSNTGVVEMRANSGNVGMVMNNDSITVYDEQGRVRVKMGKL